MPNQTLEGTPIGVPQLGVSGKSACGLREESGHLFCVWPEEKTGARGLVEHGSGRELAGGLDASPGASFAVGGRREVQARFGEAGAQFR